MRRVPLQHQLLGAGQRGQQPLVVADFLKREAAALAVFEPLLGGLVAADGEGPYGGGHGLDVLAGVEVHALGGSFVAGLFYSAGAFAAGAGG